MAYAEYQHDTYMKQSDYKKLREILGLQSVELNPSLCYIHCVPALKKPFETLLEQNKSLNCAGYLFAEDSIFCEPFSQMDTYGNGLDFCIIVPEQLYVCDEYFTDDKAQQSFVVGGKEITAELLAEALHSLPDEKRETVLLYYFFDMSEREIAKYCNIPRTTVQTRRKSSMKLLKRYLEERAYDCT